MFIKQYYIAIILLIGDLIYIYVLSVIIIFWFYFMKYIKINFVAVE